MKNQEETNAAIVKTLNELIDVCLDGQKGFQDAAEGLDANPELRARCLQYAIERGHFAKELQQEIRQFGARPDDSGTVLGALHRGWMDIRKAVAMADQDAIIAECERGEDVAKETYEKVLNDYLPPGLTGIVQRQYQKVLAAHDHFSALKKLSHTS